MNSRRTLQSLWALLGSVALIAGLAALLVGPELVPGVKDPSANLDSEWRFFATWYATAGAVLLATVQRVESSGTVIRVVTAAFFLAGLGRVLSMAVVGVPDAIFVALTVIELALGPILVPWQRAVERAAGGS